METLRKIGRGLKFDKVWTYPGQALVSVAPIRTQFLEDKKAFSMIHPNPPSVATLLQARDAQIVSSVEYVASVLEVDVPTTPIGPLTSAIFANVVSQLNQGNAEAAQKSFALLNDKELMSVSGCISWMSDDLPADVWPLVHQLFDTDSNEPFSPIPATDENLATFKSRHEQARQILAQHCPDALNELDQIVSIIMLGEPPLNESRDAFGGASTFFCPGAILANSARSRTVAQAVEVVVHEASHLLLFAIAGSTGLSENDPEETYVSPLRDDPRPIEGVFHAVFVTSRVHAVLGKVLAANDLPADLRADFEMEQEKAFSASMAGLKMVELHCVPTPKGQEVLDAIQGYWAALKA